MHNYGSKLTLLGSFAVQAGSKRDHQDDSDARGGAKRLRTEAGAALLQGEEQPAGAAIESVKASQQAQQQQGSSVRLTICRDGAVLLATVTPATEDGLGTDILVHFCGAQVQARRPLSSR